MTMHDALGLAIRWAHIAAMATLLGGALLPWLSTLVPPAFDQSGDGRALLDLAVRYEWLFWAAIGVVVMTGVGNLGAMAGGLPDRTTGWGATLTIKLATVLAFVLLSLLRTILIAQLIEVGSGASAHERRRFLRMAYGGTLGFVAAILALAVLLSHG